MSVNTSEKLLWQDRVDGTQVVTYVCLDCGSREPYETWVIGGPLDGWIVRAPSETRAKYNHRWLLSMVCGAHQYQLN